MPLTADASTESRLVGYPLMNAPGHLRVVKIARVQIDRHPVSGFILRRLARDGSDLHSTRHPTVEAAKQQAAADFAITEQAWTGSIGP
jgi:hypothetical protein